MTLNVAPVCVGVCVHLLPQSLPGRQTGAGSHKPAVSQLTLVQVVRADTIHKQVRVAAQLLKEQR